MTEGRELILVMGGARAGKSTFASALATDIGSAAIGQVAFIATAEPLDDEMRARIQKHRADRPTGWLTIEEPHDLAAALRKASGSRVVIVDCFTLFVSNRLLSIDDLDSCEAEIDHATRSFLAVVAEARQTVICVSNEVGLGLVPDTPIGRVYRDCLGKVNQVLARAADRVYWLVAGIPVQIKPR
jgi:adenosylcobinamide kinase/adenosylcobinamide-phosphate guanylyltransferase